MLGILQSHLIFPGHATQGRADAYFKPDAGCERVELSTADGDRVAALFARALDADGRPLDEARPLPTVIYFYGNGMCLAHSVEQIDRFRRLGVHVVCPDYVGYGQSGGNPSERAFEQTAEAAWDFATSRPEVDPDRIVACGWSIGGAVAIDLAVRKPVAGLIVFCTFTNLRDMTRRVLPIVPARLLLRHRFENLEKIRAIDCPILIGHGTSDRLVPASMSDRLAKAAGGRVERISVESDHNDFFTQGSGRIFGAVDRFFDAHVRGAGRSETLVGQFSEAAR